MPFLTYQLNLLSAQAIKAADVFYYDALKLKIKELRVLRLINHFPGSTPTELLANLELDKTLLSKNLALLEQYGLICRTPDAKDNRRQCLNLTEQGREVWATTEEIGRRLEKEMFSRLSGEEWLQLQQLLNKAHQSFDIWQQSN